MGYCVAGQARTTMNSIMYKSNSRMINMILRMVLMIPCDMFLRDHLKNTRRIYLFGSVKGRVDDLGDTF